ncbi:hypothetical protein [Paracoccus jiaweipingae]|uniref:hypothetical protein n=1 Tax=unclassified Paracoccus (in: a-proteobacteria) TaxID=2688777 RepID=UPI0037B301BE
MTDAAIAGLLALAGLWTGMVSIMADQLVRNQDQDTFLAWHRSFGKIFSFGNGRSGIVIQAFLVRAVTVTLFAASLFFALRALFVE